MKKQFLAILSVAISFGLLSGCSSTKPIEEPYMAPMESEYTANKNWQVKLERMPNLDTEGLFFDEDDQHIYIATESGHLAALLKSNTSRWSDQVVWQSKFDSPIVSGPTLFEGKLYFGTSKGQLVSVSAKDGSYLWQTQLSSEVISRPVIANRKVFTRTVDGKIYAVNQNGGKILWTAEHQMPSLSLRGSPEVVYHQGYIFVGWESGMVQALSAKSGSLQWETRIAVPSGRTDLERIVDVQSRLTFYDNRLFVMGYNGKLASINPFNGQFYFVKDISGYRDFVIDGQRIYVVDSEDTLYAFDINNGVQVWKQSSFAKRLIGDLAQSKGHILAVDSWGYLHWLNKLQGVEIARFKHSNEYGDGNRIARVMSKANKIYLLDEEGVITSYSIDISDLRKFQMQYAQTEADQLADDNKSGKDQSWWQSLWPSNSNEKVKENNE